jgi:hypothetical protein
MLGSTCRDIFALARRAIAGRKRREAHLLVACVRREGDSGFTRRCVFVNLQADRPTDRPADKVVTTSAVRQNWSYTR